MVIKYKNTKVTRPNPERDKSLNAPKYITTLENPYTPEELQKKQQTTTNVKQPIKTNIDGVDVTKSFGINDFANPKDYEQAKRQAQASALYTPAQLKEREVNKQLEDIKTTQEVNKQLLAQPSDLQTQGLQTGQEQTQPITKGVIQPNNTLTDEELAKLPMNERPNQIGFGGKEIMAKQLTGEEMRVFGKENIKKTLTSVGAVVLPLLAWEVGGETIIAKTPKLLTEGAVTKTGLLTKALKIGGLVGLGSGLVERERNEAKKATVSTKDTANLIVEQVKRGDISLAEGYYQFDIISQIQADQKAKYHSWSQRSLFVFVGGGMDAQIDMENAIKYTEYQRAGLPQAELEGRLDRAKRGY
jgi:hypothetical protein